MPNWKTHLEIGKRIQKSINYNNQDFNIFLLGNVLPDINNCYIVQNISARFPHSQTHFNDDETPSYIKFKSFYKSYIHDDNPLFLGYYIHLFTDYFWNNDYYTRLKSSDLYNMEHYYLQSIKQGDFMIYNDKFIQNSFHIDNFDYVLNEIKKIDRVSITQDDIINVQNFLDQKEPRADKTYKFYNESQLDELLEKTVKELLNMKKLS